MSDSILAIHGGAGAAPKEPDAARACLEQALRAGHAVYAAGGAALDIAEAAVRVLEEGGVFNAGRGGVADAIGRVMCDAAVMDGATRAAGAVAAVRGLRHPVHAARLVMQRSPHVLLVGDDAARQALEWGAAAAPDGWFLRAAAATPHGTVGAVARDRLGRVAAATSTGGTSAKLPGRVGDSPLIGAGTWADDRVAVSATGIGEYFIRCAFAHRLAMEARQGGDLRAAADRAIDEVAALGGEGGAIVLAADGAVAFPLRARAMARGRIAADGRLLTAIAGGDAE